LYRLWPVLKWILIALIIGLVINIIANLFFSDVKNGVVTFITNKWVFIILLFSILVFGLLCFFSWLSYFQKQKQDRLRLKQEEHDCLISEFSLFTTSEMLKPQDLGFVTMQIGEPSKPGRRPHYPPHIPRAAIKYDERNKEATSEIWTEDNLGKLLSDRTGFVLQGEPTVGKSRTLFNVIRNLQGFNVIRPRRDLLPTIEALALCQGKPTIILLDDLNEFAGAATDLIELITRLDKLQISWCIAATCRDGSELGVIKESADTTLRKFYEQIPLKFALRQADDAEKLNLYKQLNIGQDMVPGEIEKFPTLGHITMSDAMKFMANRFRDDLDTDQRDCLRAIKLLAYYGVLPFTHRRIAIVMEKIFNCRPERLRNILHTLTEYGFLHSDEEDPVVAEMAYISGGDPQADVVSYIPGRLVENDFAFLSKVLSDDRDIHGIILIGYSYYQKGKNDDAIKIYDEIISCFGDDSELTSKIYVAGAHHFKGFALDRLGRIEDAIITCDEIIRLLGKTPDIELNEIVAISLNNKVVFCVRLGRFKEAIQTCNELINLYGDNSELILKEQVARAFVNKGIALGNSDRLNDAIKTFEEVIGRFEKAPELVLKESAVNALYYKGIALERFGQNKKAISAFCAAWKRRDCLNEDQIKLIREALEKLGKSPESC
jgi:tetratricopeptide (TPR) repeat protein